MKHPRCILHVGMHKTGTTTIQSILFKHLESEDFHYLHLDTPNLTQELFVLFRLQKIEAILRQHRRWDHSQAFLKEHRERIRTKLQHRIGQFRGTGILSSEMISDMEEEALILLVDFLKQFYERIEVIAYIRPPQSYISSMMAQKVKEGLFTFDPALFYPHYRARFEKFDRVLGKENVKLFLYDRSQLLRQDIVADFCRHTGVKIAGSHKEKNANPTLGLEPLSLLWFYHHTVSESDRDPSQLTSDIQHLIQRFGTGGKHAFVLDPSLVDPVLDRYRSDILWMETRLGDTLRENPPVSSAITVSTEKELLAYGYKEALSLLGIEEQHYFERGKYFWMAAKIKELSGRREESEPGSSPEEEIGALVINTMLRESLLPPQVSHQNR